MDILHLMPYSPFPLNFGGALREYHILKNLTREHRVTVATYGDPEDEYKLRENLGDQLDEIHMVPDPLSRSYRRISQLYALCTDKSYTYWHSYNKEMQKLLNQLFSRNNYDAVQTEFSVMGGLDMHTDAVKVLDAHNVEYENFRRMSEKSDSVIRKMFYKREFRKMYREELHCFNKQDMIFTTSECDKKIIHEDVPQVPKYVIPNGVETDFFKPSDREQEPYSMVFTGMMAYVPNDDGMLYFLDEIFPRIQEKIPQAKIYIVGIRPTKELKARENEHIKVTGFVDDVRPYVWRSSVYVVPLRMGSGTRLKVLEALSMKKPVVSTSIGCEGINVTDGESIIKRDDPEDFANAVIELLKNKKMRKKLTENGHDLVKAKYDWPVIGDKMLEIYNSVYDKELVHAS